MKMRHALAVTLFIAAPLLSRAASPQLTGTFTGTAKINTVNLAGTLTKSKIPLTIEIAADDATTLTLGTTTAGMLDRAYSDNNGILLSTVPFRVLTFQVKNTTMKGFIQGADEGGNPAQTVIEGKFKLKKQQ
jgi:hypothetical protein